MTRAHEGVIVPAARASRLTVEAVESTDATVQLWAWVPRDDDALTGRDPEQAGVELDLPGALALIRALAERLPTLAGGTPCEALRRFIAAETDAAGERLARSV